MKINVIYAASNKPIKKPGPSFTKHQGKNLGWEEMNNRPVNPQIVGLVSQAKAIAAKIDLFKSNNGLSRADEKEIFGAMHAFEKHCDPITLFDHKFDYAADRHHCPQIDRP